MSTKCAYRKDDKTHESKDAVTGKIIRWTATKACGKNVSMFLRVEYAELFPHRRREARFFDIFGFCPEHGPNMSDLNVWNQALNDKGRGDWEKRVRNLRGPVKLVIPVPAAEVLDPKAMALAEVRVQRMVAVKSDIKRMMNQRNTEKFTLDDWRQVFEDCIDEFVVERIMES